MSRKIAPLIDIVRLEDKETKLKAFISTVLEQNMTQAGTVTCENAVLLVVRSVESPVARAVAAFVQDGTITGPVKSIIAIVPREPNEDGNDETLMTLAREHGGRILRDIRLFDAHEQIVLGTAASWVGDCMRRDPMKRDAYECYAADCGKTAGWARTSFERLWAICEPVGEARRGPDNEAVANACMGAATGEEIAEDPLRSTSG